MSPEEYRLHRIREDLASDMGRTTWQQQQSADGFERIREQFARLRTSDAVYDRDHATASVGSKAFERLAAIGIIAALIGGWVYLFTC